MTRHQLAKYYNRRNMMNTFHLRRQQQFVKKKTAIKAANSCAMHQLLQFGSFSNPDTVQQLLLLELETKYQKMSIKLKAITGLLVLTSMLMVSILPEETICTNF